MNRRYGILKVGIFLGFILLASACSSPGTTEVVSEASDIVASEITVYESPT